DANEPYLIQAGLIYRTQKGRMASKAAYEHMGLMGFYNEPENTGRSSEQMTLEDL
ncbi:MAG: Holliday junction branch migration DNA helicase RuvB, partial [Mogibacterium sp.]|nr:Holliday junction branch migration DNA helicase RuvB [Mogibacterium sp.]